jgi:hypothetical protein
MEQATNTFDDDAAAERSGAGQIVDALGNTSLFAYRVVSLVRLDGTCVLYRGAYEIGSKIDTDLGFVEKCSGPTFDNLSRRSLRWESANRSKDVLSSASRYGFEVVDEGTFLCRRDITADELSDHLATIETLP